MSRYILRYTGEGTKPTDDVQRVRDHPDVDIIDDSSPRMLLVDGSEASCHELAKAMPNWVINAETSTPLPDPHPGAPRVKEAPQPNAKPST